MLNYKRQFFSLILRYYFNFLYGFSIISPEQSFFP